MFCANCGQQVDDGLKFCTICGAPLTEEAVVSAAATTTMPTTIYAEQSQASNYVDQSQFNTPPQKKSKKPLVIILIAILVIAIALVVVFVVLKPFDTGKSSSLSSGPAATAQLSTNSNETAGGASSGGSSQDSGSASSAVFLGISSANSSSNLATGGVNTGTYYASNVLDGDSTTCWAEGSSGSGIDESITLSGSGDQLFSGFSIRNGYQKSDDIYQKNNRPKTLEVYVDGTLVDTINLTDTGLTSQTFNFTKPVVGKEIMFKIKDVYSGSKYSDCCISEINVF